jgi:hypothetical protein
MISGEQFQKLADISLYGELNCIIEDQNRHLKQNLVNLNDLETSHIKQYKKIFIYTHFLMDFFNKFYDHLSDDTIIISHNSDHCVDDTFIKYLEGNKISKWYCQNRLVSHPKLISLPIGLANSQWQHGDQQLIKSVRNTSILKNNLVFKNFDCSTNINARRLCDEITSHNNIMMSQRTSNLQYWTNIANSVFVISPPGNGIDCHRIWECLYLKSMPIVLKHEALEQFKHLPIIFVDSWEEVTQQFLIDSIPKKHDHNKMFNNIDMLDINYWKKILK